MEEANRRLAQLSVSGPDHAALARAALLRQANSLLTWDDDFGKMIVYAWDRSLLTPAEGAQFLVNAVEVQVTAEEPSTPDQVLLMIGVRVTRGVYATPAAYRTDKYSSSLLRTPFLLHCDSVTLNDQPLKKSHELQWPIDTLGVAPWDGHYVNVDNPEIPVPRGSETGAINISFELRFDDSLRPEWDRVWQMQNAVRTPAPMYDTHTDFWFEPPPLGSSGVVATQRRTLTTQAILQKGKDHVFAFTHNPAEQPRMLSACEPKAVCDWWSHKNERVRRLSVEVAVSDGIIPYAVLHQLRVRTAGVEHLLRKEFIAPSDFPMRTPIEGSFFVPEGWDEEFVEVSLIPCDEFDPVASSQHTSAGKHGVKYTVWDEALVWERVPVQRRDAPPRRTGP